MRKAFTLIELLVVISIITLMISMLLPALGSARGVARSISCLSNTRQIGIGFAIYTTENDDVLPPFSPRKPGGATSNDPRRTIHGEKWFELVAEYSSALNGEDHDAVDPTVYDDYRTGAWRCSEVSSEQMIISGGAVGWGGGYGVNVGLIRYGHEATGSWAGGSPSLMELPAPNNYFLVGDVGRPGTTNVAPNGDHVYRTWMMFYPSVAPFDLTSSGQRMPAGRHADGGVNVTFVDGHGALTPWNDLSQNRDDILINDLRATWNR